MSRNKVTIPKEKMVDKFLEERCSGNVMYAADVSGFRGDIDLVLYDEKLSRLTAVMFDPESWKIAARRAWENRLAFDEIIICAPKPEGKHSVLKAAKCCAEQGINVCFYELAGERFEAVEADVKSGAPCLNSRGRVIEGVVNANARKASC